ncbi:hypothetical protein WICPIJ_008952 [Wickerhamomyces pijperi]|uniref:Uncharacterized protein n=1 Tax=Wickerhamomyces pijperi TaxID=599730 RepID=A0A9P8PU24_WICPI|nr:hypothetical protein WICPIJ_008952 [Wickerhamomyces pijperi]
MLEQVNQPDHKIIHSNKPIRCVTQSGGTSNSNSRKQLRDRLSVILESSGDGSGGSNSDSNRDNGNGSGDRRDGARGTSVKSMGHLAG